MSWLLNTIYAGFLVVASPWLLWRYVASGKNKRGWSHKLLGCVASRESDKPCIWMHAVSVGEVILLAPVLKELKYRHPEFEFVISTTTETGFDLAVKKFPEHYTFFCPMDFTWAIKRVLKRLRPDMLVLAELELWPNLVRSTRIAGVPVAVVNGRLSANSYKGYQRFKWLVGGIFKELSVVAVQNETYARRFCRLGCDRSNVFVTGSVKFDGMETDRANDRTRALAKIAEIGENDQVFVAGSTQVEEDLIAAGVYQRLCQTNPNLRLILVPRHPERCATLVSQLNQLGIPSVLRSKLSLGRLNSSLNSGFTPSQTPSQSPGWKNERDVDTFSRLARRDRGSESTNRPVLIVDVIGELGSWWGCADVAFVGGSLGRRGGQNMIEPAAFGLPISFGPNTENFRQIVDELLGHDAATVVSDELTLKAFVERAISDPDWANPMGVRAMNVVMNHLGASQRTVNVLSDVIRGSGKARIDAAAISERAA